MSSLDELAARAKMGLPGAEDELVRKIRTYLIRVAKRRVQAEDLEDVVQDALTVVCRLYRERASDAGVLPWSFQVLRNVIGNFYRTRDRRDRALENAASRSSIHDLEEGDLHPLSRLQEEETRTRLWWAIEQLDDRCSRLFKAIHEALGSGPGGGESEALFDRLQHEHPGMNRNAFYVMLHRCRQRLRRILRESDTNTDFEGLTH